MCLYAHVSVCVCAYMCVSVFVCLRVYVYVHMLVCIYVCTFVYALIYLLISSVAAAVRDLRNDAVPFMAGVVRHITMVAVVQQCSKYMQ